jgi:hypothetical protein
MAVYEGLTRRQRLWIVGVAAIIVVASLVAAAMLAVQISENVRYTANDQALVNALTAGIADPLHQVLLRAHALDTLANIKVVINKQSLVLVCFAGAFALMTVGFALFMIGADGVFQVQAEKGADAKFLFSGTAPGLLCFFLAASLIVTGILHRYELKLGELSLSDSRELPQPPARCANQIGNDCVPDSVLQGLTAPEKK